MYGAVPLGPPVSLTALLVKVEPAPRTTASPPPAISLATIVPSGASPAGALNDQRWTMAAEAGWAVARRSAQRVSGRPVLGWVRELRVGSFTGFGGLGMGSKKLGNASQRAARPDGRPRRDPIGAVGQGSGWRQLEGSSFRERRRIPKHPRPKSRRAPGSGITTIFGPPARLARTWGPVRAVL